MDNASYKNRRRYLELAESTLLQLRNTVVQLQILADALHIIREARESLGDPLREEKRP